LLVNAPKFAWSSARSHRFVGLGQHPGINDHFARAFWLHGWFKHMQQTKGELDRFLVATRGIVRKLRDSSIELRNPFVNVPTTSLEAPRSALPGPN
jgi:hypothetical protein